MSQLAGSAKLLRAINSSATLAHLLQAGQLTRAELRERTGLSKPTSSEMLRLLTDAGLAIVAGRTAGGLGPTAEIYAPNGDAAYAVAISVREGTEQEGPGLATALCDLSGTIRDRAEARVDFVRTPPGKAVFQAVRRACDRAGVDRQRVRHVQVGVPGAYDLRTDTIHQVEVLGWNQPGVLQSIRARLDLPPATSIALDNDVKLAAIAERHRGVAAGVDSFCLLWLGNGIGLATDLGGALLRGARGGAGEIGYLPLCVGHHDARDNATLQELVGGPAVLDLAAEHGIRATTPAQAVAAGGSDEQSFLQRLAERIAFALAPVIAVLDPPLVVLAGEVGQAGGARLRDAVAAAMHPSSNAFAGLSHGSVEIAVTAVTDDAVLLGGLDAGLSTVHESLVSSLAQPSPTDQGAVHETLAR